MVFRLKTDYWNLIKKAVIAIVVLSAATAFLYWSEIGCVWYYFFGIKCPGCGMTRAVISLLKFDIPAAFSYHYMVWSLPVLFLYYLFDGKLFKNRYINNLVPALIGFGFIVNYIFN